MKGLSRDKLAVTAEDPLPRQVVAALQHYLFDRSGGKTLLVHVDLIQVHDSNQLVLTNLEWATLNP